MCSRDIAMLEVTILLHQDSSDGLVAACAALYTIEWETCTVAEGASHHQANTLAFIEALRTECLRLVPIDIFAFTVLDQVLVQLGGLHFGSSYNKIRAPDDACLLAALVARWYTDLRSRTASIS